MKKRLIALALCLVMLMAGCAPKAPDSTVGEQTPAPNSTAAEGIYTPGTYEGKAQGMGGEVVVTITFDANSITGVTAVGESETPNIGTLALEQLPTTIMEAQSIEVDAIASATVTSTAILAAAQSCMNQAMGIEPEDVATEETADVIVVGAGAAGLSAAASAVASGASVIVLEANSFLGGAAGTSMGNLIDLNLENYVGVDRNDASLEVYASYGENFFPEPWKTDYIKLMEQIEEYTNNGAETGRFVTLERIMVDHYVTGMGTDAEGNTVSLDYDIIRSGMESALDIYNWLAGYGMTSSPTPRREYLTTPDGQGMGLIQTLAKAAEGAEIRLNTRARKLITENGKVVGVIAEDADGNQITYHANSGVVLATGGFSSNGEMVAEYQNMGTGLTSNIPSNTPAGNRGDGILMAQELGAQLRDMSFMQTVLRGYQSLATSAEAGNITKASQLLVNDSGERFLDGDVKNQHDGVEIAIGDQKMIDSLNAVEGFADDLIGRGIAYKADTLEDLAKQLGVDAATLTASINNFNACVDAGSDPEFGCKSFNGKVEDGPFYAVKLQVACHLTFGGLVIDTDSRVLDTQGQPIEGLYAGGDVLSGYEGVVHQSGNCLTIVINTGRIAGQNAAKTK